MVVNPLTAVVAGGTDFGDDLLKILVVAVIEEFGKIAAWHVGHDMETGYRCKRFFGFRAELLVTNGRELFGRLDPGVSYGKCQRLRELLDKMLELAGGVG
jgi:hypothetical protein